VRIGEDCFEDCLSSERGSFSHSREETLAISLNPTGTTTPPSHPSNMYKSTSVTFNIKFVRDANIIDLKNNNSERARLIEDAKN